MRAHPAVRSRLRRHGISTAGVLVVLAAVAVACGDDDDASTQTVAAATAATADGTTPEERQSTDAEVTAGLAALPGLVATAVATVGTPEAATAFEPIEASWRTYEGTVRTKEPDIYLAIEDEFANLQTALQDGDKAAADEAATKISAAVDDYLAKHP